jgi:hypothetical protein
MEQEKVFANGIIFKQPRDNAPDYVKGSISFKVNEAIAFLNMYEKNGWCNINLMISKGGKPYAELDTWEPNKQSSNQQDYSPKTDPAHKTTEFGDDIPF